jgi:lysophospholipase L1-like esterase
MIELMQSQGIEVALIGVPEPGLFLTSASLYNELAEQYGVPIDNDIMADLQSNQQLKSDRVHLNAEGYRQFAAAVAKLLSDAGAIQQN